MFYKIAFISLSVLVIHVSAKGRCEDVAPDKDVDWKKLTGSWYYLLLFGPSRPSCRKMDITKVNITKKIVNLKFSNVARYNGYQPNVNDNQVYFTWTNNSALVSAQTLQANKKRTFFSKFRKAKKSDVRSSSVMKGISYTVVTTDYENYIVLLQCPGRISTVGIAVKNKKTSPKLVKEIFSKLTAAGINTEYYRFQNPLNCM